MNHCHRFKKLGMYLNKFQKNNPKSIQKNISKRIIALTLATVVVSALGGCLAAPELESVEPKSETVGEGEDEVITAQPKRITDFTMFIATTGEELSEDNEIRELIAEKTGVRLEEKWITNENYSIEAVEKLIESGDLPDFVDGLDGMKDFYDAGLLVPWDEYLDKYPNLKELYTDEEWKLFRQEDGHIYWANVFGNIYGEDKTKYHNGEAFWIQVKVLEYFDYPEITTLDEYFDILEKYYDENKFIVNDQGEIIDIIPYTALCDDWRYFCIENAPNFLDGYMNDGTISVNTKDYDTPTVISYDNTPTAKRYLAKLNDFYQKGLMDKDFDTRTYEEYIELLKTGAVLGMCDQFWDFGYALSENGDDQKLCEPGCQYVPLGLTIDEDMPQYWYVRENAINYSSGIAVTTACENPELAFSFLNAMLDQEIHDYRFWGIEGEDYLIDENGLYYRNDEMRARCEDEEYKKSHFCQYSYLPQWIGTSRDNINAMQPYQQSSEYLETLAIPLAQCFRAYDVGGYVEMIGSEEVEIPEWFPLYNFSSYLYESPGCLAYKQMTDCKHEWIPKVVKAQNFESAWKKYMKAYDACKPEDYIEEMQYKLDEKDYSFVS